jgi:hypothetical protein
LTSPLARGIALSIRHNESRGNYEAKGKSGEYGAYQYILSTFKGYSRELTGEILPFTPTNQDYVTVLKVQQWLDRGYTPQQIFLMWNAGEQAKKCSAGINRHGVRYNSCSYVKEGLRVLADHYSINSVEEIHVTKN